MDALVLCTVFQHQNIYHTTIEKLYSDKLGVQTFLSLKKYTAFHKLNCKLDGCINTYVHFAPNLIS